MVIHFENVGRDKKCWTAEVTSLSDRILVAQIRAHRALFSHEIEFLWYDDGKAGKIFVGGVRCVGSFQVEGGLKVTI